MSLYFVRRIIYEWFLRTHLIFTIVAVVALWFHFIPKKPTARIFLRIGICLWTILTLIHAAIFLLRNFVRGKAIAEVTKLQQAMKVAIKVPRPWNVKAGQYIFLTIPAAGITTTFQSHPFMIAWWDRSSDGLTISLLVKPRRGFTGQLLRMADQKLTVFIDGPFGLQHNLGVFGTVIMFATGIGIAGHMPYIKELVSGYNNCEVRTRRIVLIWQLDVECKCQFKRIWYCTLHLLEPKLISNG
jgi:predicted ferric reductase